MVRVLGDIHGILDGNVIAALQEREAFLNLRPSRRLLRGRHYHNLVIPADYSVQVGDMGFNYTPLNKLDSNCHKFIGGNHDNYDHYHSVPHSLGDYGECDLGSFNFFFIRGAKSPDWKQRTEGVDWWRKEELDYQTGLDALEAYKDVKPRIMISHDCPASVTPFISSLTSYDYERTFDEPLRSSSTQVLLEGCFYAHQPEIWLFGHYHINQTYEKDGTLFVCLGELNYVDFDENGNMGKLK